VKLRLVSVGSVLIAVLAILAVTSGASAYPPTHTIYVRDCKDAVLQPALRYYGVVMLRQSSVPAGFAGWTAVGRVAFDRDTPGCVTTLYTGADIPDNGGTPRVMQLEYEIVTVQSAPNPAGPGNYPYYPRWIDLGYTIWNNWAWYGRVGF